MHGMTTRCTTRLSSDPRCQAARAQSQRVVGRRLGGAEQRWAAGRGVGAAPSLCAAPTMYWWDPDALRDAWGPACQPPIASVWPPRREPPAQLPPSAGRGSGAPRCAARRPASPEHRNRPEDCVGDRRRRAGGRNSVARAPGAALPDAPLGGALGLATAACSSSRAFLAHLPHPGPLLTHPDGLEMTASPFEATNGHQEASPSGDYQPNCILITGGAGERCRGRAAGWAASRKRQTERRPPPPRPQASSRPGWSSSWCSRIPTPRRVQEGAPRFDAAWVVGGRGPARASPRPPPDLLAESNNLARPCAPLHVPSRRLCRRRSCPRACLHPTPARARPALQVVVLDKLDYCATLNNLASVRNCPNFK